jgi:hypothetical protein
MSDLRIEDLGRVRRYTNSLQKKKAKVKTHIFATRVDFQLDFRGMDSLGKVLLAFIPIGLNESRQTTDESFCIAVGRPPVTHPMHAMKKA